jgi:hypothetical protein
MDYLDPRKDFWHTVTLYIGYALVAVAIVIAALVLLYQAYGFGIAKNGTVIQNGLAFFSSHPNPAQIYVDGKLRSETTNTRMVLPAGIYDVKIAREGYIDWQRTINLEGGKVQHYDYPFLIPQKLVTNKIQSFASEPGFMTQSPDHRWLLIQKPGSITEFIVYDLKSPEKEPLPLVLPANVLSPGTSQSWQLAEWSADNKHVMLQHIFDGKTEHVMIDRGAPEKSVNLNTLLAVNPDKISLKDRKYDQYYLYNQAAASLLTASLKEPSPVVVLERVLAYKSYGDDIVLYATDRGAPDGKVLVRILNGDETLTVRQFPAGTSYVLDLAKYDGEMYVAAGAAATNRAYIYKDPLGQLSREPDNPLGPQQVLHVEQVNYLSFSASAQFIVAENANRFGVYDFENKVGYNYTNTQPLDPPQPHANWMDGNRLVYVSGGKLLVFDYDNLNQRTLMPMNSRYLPAFDPDYEVVYGMAAINGSGQFELTGTDLLTEDDQ